MFFHKGGCVAESKGSGKGGFRCHYSDYVFKPSYRLAPLAEVEQKIQELGHLPGMPSAAQVEKQGMDLGEQNRLLVVKVEELTLHLIRMQKQLDALTAAKK